MTDLRFEISNGEPPETDKQVLSAGMLAYHASQGHPRKTDVYSIFLKDEANTVVGGVIVSFLWNGMAINSLWVDETLRGQGWGRKLMDMAEKEGIKRGCTVAYTDTFTWQAPGFYKKLGYSEYGKIDNFPPGNSLTYFKKGLKQV